MWTTFRAIVSHPATHAIVGFAMMGSALYELGAAFLETAEMTASSAHGVALFGLVQGLKALSELFEGAELLETADGREAEGVLSPVRLPTE